MGYFDNLHAQGKSADKAANDFKELAKKVLKSSKKDDKKKKKDKDYDTRRGRKDERPDSFEEFMDSYNLRSKGAGSQKDPQKSRFSALDVRDMFDEGTDRFDLSKAEAAREVLDFADDMEGRTRMGGGTRKALDNLRKHLREDKPDKDDDKLVGDPDDIPKDLQDSYDHYAGTDLTKDENKPPRLDSRFTNDPSKDAISGGDDLVQWANDKFIPHLEAEANYGTEQIGHDMGYFLDKFVYGPTELGDINRVYEKYKKDLEEAAEDDDD